MNERTGFSPGHAVSIELSRVLLGTADHRIQDALVIALCKKQRRLVQITVAIDGTGDAVKIMSTSVVHKPLPDHVEKFLSDWADESEALDEAEREDECFEEALRRDNPVL